MTERPHAALLDVAVAYGDAARAGAVTPAIVSALTRAATEYRDMIAAGQTARGLDELIRDRWEQIAGDPS